MECLGVEPGAAWWKVQTNPLSNGGTPRLQHLFCEVFEVFLISFLFNISSHSTAAFIFSVSTHFLAKQEQQQHVTIH